MNEEIWKSVKGYEGKYEVSNLGRVKSLNYNRTGKEKLLSPSKDRDNYLQVSLCRNGETKKYKVHRLVLMTFSPVANMSKLLINHKDENKLNNRLENLEWCTALYNNTYNDRHKRVGEKLRGRTLSETTKQKLSESLKGHIVSEETKQKLSESLKGHIVSEETKQKLSESLKGRTFSEETKQKMSIPIVQIDLSTNKVVNVWSSSHEAKREGGFHQGAINDCCRGKRKSHKGYKWQYLHYYISQIDPRIKKVVLFGKEYVF